MQHRRREWLFRVLLTIGVPLLVLCAAELLLRIAGFGYPPHFWIAVEGTPRVTTNDKFAWRFFPPSLARTPVPELVESRKLSNTRRIFVLGESAAMGFPEPAFGLARMLQVILEHRHPGVQWEVINAAMTAINSHTILPIARECARLQPDAFVLLMGNNEVVGPYGPGTVFGRSGLSRPLVRLSVWQTSTRLGQAAAEIVRGGASNRTEWRGMEMFIEQQLARTDPKLDVMYRNFEANVRDIVETGLGAGAFVVLATVPVNLKDCPPFASLHRAGMTGAEEAQWNAAFKRGKEAESRGQIAEALSSYRESLAVDPEYAEVHFRLARCLLAGVDATGAREHYRRARDLDALRFRADSRINDIVRNVAAAHGKRDVILVDADAQFGLGGEDLFYEHVHLTPEGNYSLASALADQLGGTAREGRPAPTFDSVRRTLALTRWDESRMRAQIAALMERPPFTNQIDHDRQLSRFKSLIERGPLQTEALRIYESAVQSRPADIHLRAKYAELLRESGKPAESATQWAMLIEREAGRKTWHASHAAALSDAGQQQEAIEAYNRALAIDSRFDLAHFGLGVAKARQLKFTEAEEHYRKALEINPNYAEAEYNLAGVLNGRGQTAEAQAALERAIEIRPAFAEAQVALAQMLARAGKPDLAMNHYRKALESRPDLPEAHYDLGVLLVQGGQVESAIHHYEQAIQLRPEYSEAYNNLGTALARKGDYASAARAFTRAIEIKPSFEAARDNLQRVRRLSASQH